MKIIYLFSVLLFLAFSCKKTDVEIPLNKTSPTFVNYKIAQGQHYANNDSTLLLETNYKQLTFICKFDSSAIYNTTSIEHQSDINKLYGFSDNNMFHQMYSARFGWNWLNDGLHLWAYTYNDGNRSYKDLGPVALGNEVNCTITVMPTAYIFGVNGTETSMSRTATTATAIGYKLFPYFGGHEPAPHDITILIKEL